MFSLSKMADFLKVLVVFLLCNFTNSETGNEVIELNDANFEHLTQASTGATTGDWLVLFTKGSECPSCQAAKEVFSKLHASLSRKMNIAVVNAEENSGLLRRFGIKKYPATYFFRHGSQFVYTGELDEENLEKFATGGYQNSLKEPVKKPLSSFDIWKEDTIKEIMMCIKHRKLPSYSTLGIAIGTFVFSLSILLCCCAGSSPDMQSKKDQ